MQLSCEITLDMRYPTCRSFLDADVWERIVRDESATASKESFDQFLEKRIREFGLPQFLPELARLEFVHAQVAAAAVAMPSDVAGYEINPTIRLVECTWKGLGNLVVSGGIKHRRAPVRGEERVLVFRHPASGEVVVCPATAEDLLVLKMITEKLNPDTVAEENGLSVGVIDWALDRAVDKGLLVAPRSLIRRDPALFPGAVITDATFLESPFFTIQWHITQACDLHCKHCYDRSSRSSLTQDHALTILDDLRAFCKNRHVLGQVSFSGGNPLLYPHFLELYRAACDRGFVTAILGNPTSRTYLEKITAIRKPAFFQVSLEGLRAHNDYIRGRGTFDNVMKFLDILRRLAIPSQVMLTLTKDNLDQVLPLAEHLRGRADYFTFNRLAQVGEGANLLIPTPGEYDTFLDDYLAAAEENPIMGLKDNLFNRVRYTRGLEPFGGCAGYGCSAAFNFIAILPDGEAHACRKFPSLIGNVYEQSIAEIYDSDTARRYRTGTAACRSCPIRPVCGGCLAVVHGMGLDIFTDRDPFCVMGPPEPRQPDS